MRHVSRVVLPGLFLALPALTAAEDLTIISKTTIGKEAPVTTTQYMSANKVRTSNGETDTIVDVATGKMWVIYPKKKEYFEFTREEMTAAMTQLEQQLSGPALEILAKMGGAAKDPEVRVEKTGPSRKVAGYDCDPYKVTLGESIKYEICAAPALQAPPQYFDALKGAYSIIGPMGKRFEKPIEEMKKIKGFPLVMNSAVDVMIIRQDIRSEATGVKKGPIAASVFAVPAGYTKKDSPFKAK